MTIAKQQVALELMQFMGPTQKMGSIQLGHSQNRDIIVGDVAVSRENRVRFAVIGAESNEVADVLVAQQSELIRRHSRIGGTMEDAWRDQLIRERLEMVVGQRKTGGRSDCALDKLERAARVGGNLHREQAVVVVSEQMKSEAGLL